MKSESGKVAAVAAILVIFVVGSESALYYLNSTVTPTTLTSTTMTDEIPHIPINVPWSAPGNRAVYYLVVPNSCSGPAGMGTCFSGNFSEAFIFTCLKEAASPQGCTARINSTTRYWEYNTITVWYSYGNQTAKTPSWPNCVFDWPGRDPEGHTPHLSAYCAPMGANGFILTQPMGPIP